jgi:hypothetical protein
MLLRIDPSVFSSSRSPTGSVTGLCVPAINLGLESDDGLSHNTFRLCRSESILVRRPRVVETSAPQHRIVTCPDWSLR